jgi:LmbE family N-acetylglucosaminyl deacetylase
MVSKGEAGIDAIPPEEVGSLRAQEEINSARVVGVDTVEFLDHTDGVIEYGLPLRRDLSRAIRQHRPDVLITINHHLQFFSGHLNMADHRWVGLAVFDAARDAGNRWIFPELLDEGHQPWNDVRFVAVFGSTVPTHVVDVSEHWETGLASLREHKVYLENLGDVGNGPFEFLTAHAREAGAAVGCRYASYAELVLINEPF